MPSPRLFRTFGRFSACSEMGGSIFGYTPGFHDVSAFRNLPNCVCVSRTGGFMTSGSRFPHLLRAQNAGQPGLISHYMLWVMLDLLLNVLSPTYGRRIDRVEVAVVYSRGPRSSHTPVGHERLARRNSFLHGPGAVCSSPAWYALCEAEHRSPESEAPCNQPVPFCHTSSLSRCRG